jgi:predicted XRE-type DNA-binding protein
MLSAALVEEIDRLLHEGELSQRKIARCLGVSRGTVSAIASGRRGLFGREPADDDSADRRGCSIPVRCPRCGYRIYLPCLICRTRDHRRQQDLKISKVRVGRCASGGLRALPWQPAAQGNLPC